VPAEVDVFDDHRSARPDVPPEGGEQASRIGQMRQEESRIDVPRFERDVRDARLRGFPPRDVDLDLVDVHPERSTRGPGRAGELARDVAAAAPDVETHRARRDAHFVEERAGRRGRDLREQAKAFPPLDAAADDVLPGSHGSQLR
jgi:hypothetical protein